MLVSDSDNARGTVLSGMFTLFHSARSLPPKGSLRKARRCPCPPYPALRPLTRPLRGARWMASPPTDSPLGVLLRGLQSCSGGPLGGREIYMPRHF